MVTPISPGSFPQAAGPAGFQNSTASRAISEARRLMLKNRITGSDAVRIANMLSQAEQTSAKGKAVDAERIAREAVDLAKEASGSPLPQANAASDDEEAANAPQEAENEGNPAQPASKTLYQDGSGDSGISYQFAQPLSAEQAPFAVLQHELSHVRRETTDAILNGQRVLTSVTVHSGIHPETGERHVSGGRARVVVFPEVPPPSPPGAQFDAEA